MDETVDPCEKFYDYACGNWNAFHPIPRDRGGYDTFEILREDLDTKLISMLKESISESDNNATTAAKVLYSSCMNTSRYYMHILNSILRRPIASFSILQHPSASNSVLQRLTASCSVLQRPVV